MILVFSIDLIIICALTAIALLKRFEDVLPVAACLLLLFPVESQIRLPGLFDLTTQRVIVIVLIGLYFMCGRKASGSEPTPLKYPILILLAWQLLSSAISVVPSVSYKAVLSQSLDFFMLYYIYVKTVSTVDTVHKILGGFVAGMFICSIFGTLEIYRDWSVVSLFPPAPHRFSALLGGVSDRGVRAEATFGHAILFGAALAMAIPMALYLAGIVKSKTYKGFLWIATLLMFLNIYKTSSRGPWLAIILTATILLVLAKGPMRRFLLTIALLTATVLITRPGVLTTIVNLYHETQDPDTAQGVSYQWRYALYQLAHRELSKDLVRGLVGYGPESFFYLGLEGEFQGAHVKFDSCDSSVVELMMDTGYVGFLLVCTLFGLAGSFTLRRFFSLSRPTLCLVFFTNLCAFAFLMTNVQLFGWGQQSDMLWIVLGLAMIYPRLLVNSRSLASGMAVSQPKSERQVVGRRWLHGHPELVLPNGI